MTESDHNPSPRQHLHMKGQIIDPATGQPWVPAEVPDLNGAFIFVLDGGGGEIADAKQLDLRVPVDCTLVGWSILADQAGAIVIDVWRDTFANFPPTDADTITGGAEPEIAASAAKAESEDLTAWTVELSEGDCLRVNVDSCTTITRATLTLRFSRG